MRESAKCEKCARVCDMATARHTQIIVSEFNFKKAPVACLNGTKRRAREKGTLNRSE